MKLLRGLDAGPHIRGGAVSIGNFDGVHLGHQRIASRLVSMARHLGGPAVVLTFDPPPVMLLRPGQVPPRLTTVETKAEYLAACGVDIVIVYPTDHALLNLTPEEFFASIVRGRLDARGLVEGPNFFFGHNRAGNVDTLRALCQDAGIPFEVVTAQSAEGTMISSSAVRRLIDAGDLRTAAQWLGHPHRVTGRVARGAARGRTLGFPTANLERIEVLLPPDGVYAGIAAGLDRPYVAAVNIGPNPTFAEQGRKFEAHLVGFTGDLYDRDLSIDILARVRDTRKFSGPEELRGQLAQDVATAETLVAAWQQERINAAGAR